MFNNYYEKKIAWNDFMDVYESLIYFKKGFIPSTENMWGWNEKMEEAILFDSDCEGSTPKENGFKNQCYAYLKGVSFKKYDSELKESNK